MGSNEWVAERVEPRPGSLEDLYVRGGNVAVVALEGSGSGRFVYSLTDGRTDEGRRPEAQVEWQDVGQGTAGGSFAPPGRA